MEQEKEKIYFGHPANSYNTEDESRLVAIIKERLPYDVENPNQEHHQKGYRKYKANPKYKNGMEYYYQNVLPHMAAGVFLPFKDGMFGAGVVHEAEFLDGRGKPIYQIDWDGKIEIMSLNSIVKQGRVLSIEETRERIYKAKKK
jgi:hypothetical protein